MFPLQSVERPVLLLGRILYAVVTKNQTAVAAMIGGELPLDTRSHPLVSTQCICQCSLCPFTRHVRLPLRWSAAPPSPPTTITALLHSTNVRSSRA